MLGVSFVVGTIFAINSHPFTFRPLNADAPTYSIVLNHSNAPEISEGAAAQCDSKGITWEYQNVESYNSGHVTLNNGGYCGISSTTAYGVTGISNLEVNFTTGENGELWLLTSPDGITWGESELLASGTPTTAANQYRYIRFYNYDADDQPIHINSIAMNYSCSGISATEDIDSAKYDNVIATSGLTYSSDYINISPNSIDGEAVSFTKSGNSSTTITIGFGKTYTIGAIEHAKIEFDMKTSSINYGKTVVLVNGTKTFGSVINSKNHSAYKCTNIIDDWYHIEVPVTAFSSTISGYDKKDLPASDILTKEINGIKINAGTCTIDNLRITGSPCELGIFNSPTYQPVVGEIYWLKVSWVGVLYAEEVEMSFSDDTMARRIPLTDPKLKHGSPFYLEWLASGTCTITCTVVCGYNRRVQTVNFTVTVK